MLACQFSGTILTPAEYFRYLSQLTDPVKCVALVLSPIASAIFSEEALMSAVEDRVMTIVAEMLEIDREEITSDSPFATDLGVDSLDQEGLMLEFERAFSVRFPPGSVDQVQSIREVVALIEKAQSAAA